LDQVKEAIIMRSSGSRNGFGASIGRLKAFGYASLAPHKGVRRIRPHLQALATVMVW
jgi:hypothetical protein